MSATKRPGYTAVTMPTAVRDRLQRAALTLSAEIGQRVPLAAIALAALTVAEQHPDEFRAALTNNNQEG